MSYLERYEAGERSAVRAELVGLGEAVRSEPVYLEVLDAIEGGDRAPEPRSPAPVRPR